MQTTAQTFRDSEVPRLRWTEFEALADDEDDGGDVIEGLTATPKTLPCKYFYDDRGSELFVDITRTPEYYLTRTEEAILRVCAPDIARRLGPCEILELGSGSAHKTRVLLEALYNRDLPLRFLPVDVSGRILIDSSRQLLRKYPKLEVWGLVGTYEQALAELPQAKLQSRLTLFLGSTIGNMTDEETTAFLGIIRQALSPGDHFLVGVDLQKDPRIIEAAYNDAAGLTAAFNLNILAHLNSRFGGNFDVARFRHRAPYNPEHHWVEMRLESLEDQAAGLADLDLEVALAAGETIWTEVSRKFHLPDISEVFAAQGFETVEVWTDPNDWFGLMLFRID